MKLVNDDVVWTCENTLEDYSDNCREPRQVKLKVNTERGIVYGHSFNEETGKIDIDPNATIVAYEDNCFATRKEANDYYVSHLKLFIAELQETIDHFNKTRID